MRVNGLFAGIALPLLVSFAPKVFAVEPPPASPAKDPAPASVPAKSSAAPQSGTPGTATPVIAPSPVSAPSAVPVPAPSETPTIAEDMLKLRDPFRRPEITFKASTKTDLERFPVDAFKLMGIMTGPDRIKALLLAPDGKTYVASEKMRIGMRGGIIQKIDARTIQVREKVVNVVGQEETIESEIRLPSEGKLVPKDGTR